MVPSGPQFGNAHILLLWDDGYTLCKYPAFPEQRVYRRQNLR
ncbi:hypothetical protein RSAG8_04727, partial [Rhizoctonia solani AG-8 WAC10335]